MTKFELMHLVQINKNAEKTYKIDELIKSHGHNVLRLPPYMCDLNPIELAWAQLKRKMHVGRHVEKIEQEYWTNDRIIEDTEFNFENSDSDDSDGSSNGTSSSSSSSSSSEDL